MWHALWDPIAEDWRNGNQGEAIGRGLFTIVEAVVGTRGAGAATRTASVTSRVTPTPPRPPSGPSIAANQAAGNAARDALAAANPGSHIEVGLRTDAGLRVVDVLTPSNVAIESKVGLTGWTSAVRSQVAKDQLLLQSGQVDGVLWVFTRSSVTGRVGPTAKLAEELAKAGIPWRTAP